MKPLRTDLVSTCGINRRESTDSHDVAKRDATNEIGWARLTLTLTKSIWFDFASEYDWNSVLQEQLPEPQEKNTSKKNHSNI